MTREMNKFRRIILTYYNLRSLEMKIIVTIRKTKEIYLNSTQIGKTMKMLINIILRH